MPDEKLPTNNGTQEEGDDLIKLGNLLHVKRSDTEKLSVEKIMRSDLSLQEKIKRIEKIDQAASEKPVSRTEPGTEETLQPVKKRPVREPEPPMEEVIIPREQKPLLKKSPVYVKASHTPLPYLSYLFREYRKIRNFGRKTHILEPVLFPPSVRMKREAGISFTKNLQPVAAKLLEILNPVLDVGWLYLEKTDYNLLAAMKKLCVEICATNFHLLNYKDKKLVNRLRTLENLFLTLQYRPEYPERVIFAAEKVLNIRQTIRGDPNLISKLVRKILSRHEMLPSLYNFLLGLNMRKSNRYFTMNELIRRSSGEIIDSKEFDCDPRIYEKIQSYIRKSVKSLRDLSTKKQEIQKQRKYLPANEKGEADFSQLQLFYDALQEENKYNYSKDRENVVIFIPRFLQLFVRTFENLLNRKVKLMERGESELFSKTFFQIEFTKLNHLINKMEKIVFTFPHFPLSRYLGIKTSNTGPIAVETEFMHLTEESMVHLLNIAKKLSNVLALRQKPKQGEEKVEPLDLNILRGKSFSLPYENELIESDTLINGRTVFQALSTAVTVIFLTGVVIGDQTSVSLLNMERYVDQKIQSILEKMERITDQETFRKIKESIIEG